MPEITEAQTYMKPKAQFQNKIRDLEEKLAAVLKKNAKLEEENNKLLKKFNTVIDSIILTLDVIGCDGPAFVQWEMPKFKQKILDSDSELEIELKNYQEEIRIHVNETGKFSAHNALYCFARDIYTYPTVEARTKWRVLRLLLDNHGFTDKEVVDFVLTNMTNNK